MPNPAFDEMPLAVEDATGKISGCPQFLTASLYPNESRLNVRKHTRPEVELRAQLKDAPPVRDFFAALAAEGPIKLIAEVKKASPSAG